MIRDSKVISTICKLINTDVSFISLDPKRLSIMIVKTQNSTAIKALLNQLFQRSRKGLWNSYDTSIAISYLIQSEFKHIDLLTVLNKNSANLKDYYDNCCEDHFILRFVIRELIIIYILLIKIGKRISCTSCITWRKNDIIYWQNMHFIKTTLTVLQPI